MKTELIIASRLVFTKAGEKYIITTATGAEVWLPKASFDPSADTITYVAYAKGDKVIAVKDSSTGKYKKGDEIILESANNAFKGMSKQIVKKHDTLSIMDHLISKGITPTFALAS